ncbi:MAG: exopolyphosphatase [Crocinitomicaceae bacterium]|tara:strand:- start:1945 stop:2826 length:882 start_codon:yes stop_codon:yes gene_type:complete
MKYGAIDIGTNAARLLIGEVVHDSGRSFVKKISYTRIPLRLGDDVFSLGRIDAKKKLDLINTMQAFKIIADIFEVAKLNAVATSAMREAENSDQILLDVKGATGIDLQLISGETEANVILGTFMLLDLDKGNPFVVIDVGGGSTEINIFRQGQKVGSRSFKLGTIRMLKGKVFEPVWEELNDWVQSFVHPYESHLIYGTGGNINKAHKLLAHAPKDAVSVTELDELRKELEVLDVEGRMKRYQLRPDRADVIVPALEIYSRVMSNFTTKLIHVPKIGLSDGMVYQMHLQQNKM